MLTACIVFIPGSAGNLLQRSLSLDPATVPYGKAITAKDRFIEYNNWDSNNWTESEIHLDVDFKTIPDTYVNHEISEEKLIHRLHPEQYEDGELTLWNASYKWKNKIFIEVDNEDIEFVTHLAQLKRRDLQHIVQIPNEIKAYNRLIDQATYIINFKTFFDNEKFYKETEKICSTIDVNYYDEYVKEIHKKWIDETCKLKKF